MFPYATLSETEILEQFETSLADGLPSGRAEERLARTGHNEIEADQVQWWEILVRQFRSAFIYLLLVAAVIVFAIGEYIDGAVILGFVAINTALGFFQEYRSEQSLRALQQFIRPKARVRRDSQWTTVESRDLVPGDIIQTRDGGRRAGRRPGASRSEPRRQRDGADRRVRPGPQAPGRPRARAAEHLREPQPLLQRDIRGRRRSRRGGRGDRGPHGHGLDRATDYRDDQGEPVLQRDLAVQPASFCG